jgi:hypothetical protein
VLAAEVKSEEGPKRRDVACAGKDGDGAFQALGLKGTRGC